MGLVINAQVNSYEALDDLKTIHRTVLNEIDKEITGIKELLQDGHGFHVEETSKKVLALLNALETMILPQVKEAFEASEQSVISMEKMLINYDKF